MLKKTIPKLKEELDTHFSKFIRLRDALITTGTKTHAKCVTCGVKKEWKLMDAGHWMGRVRGATRYDERNVHAQCKRCNAWGSGQHEEYRRALIEMYGERAADELYLKSNSYYKFETEWLTDMIKYYKEEYKEMLENN